MDPTGKYQVFAVQADRWKIFRDRTVNTVSQVTRFEFIISIIFFCRIVDGKLVALAPVCRRTAGRIH